MDYKWFVSLAPSRWLLEGLSCHLHTYRLPAFKGPMGYVLGRACKVNFVGWSHPRLCAMLSQSTALLFTLFTELGQEERGNRESSTFCHFTFTPLPETHCPSEFSAELVCQSVSTCPLTFLFLLSSSLWKFLSVFRAKGIALSSVGRVLAQHM